jgi:hypothetical protein
LFLSVRGFLDYAGPNWPLAFNVVVRVAFLLQDGVGVLNHAFFEAQSPRPLMPLSRLRPAPRDARRKTRGQDGFATLLSRRALSSPTNMPVYPDAPWLEGHISDSVKFT